MNCPKCRSKAAAVNYQGIEIDRCTACGGIWFDMLEHEDLKRLSGSETIDSGNRKNGRSQNAKGDITCPKCSVAMLKMVMAKQNHIWYEGCPQCYGVFFDAGEFKDFKSETFLDIIKGFLAKERT